MHILPINLESPAGFAPALVRYEWIAFVIA